MSDVFFHHQFIDAMQFTAFASGIATLLLFWVLYRLYAGTWDLTKIYEGADGNASTSKLQWFLWTVVIIFAYVVVYAARLYKGDLEAIDSIPQNLLIAMGFSITSMIAAKGITVAQVTSGQRAAAQPGSGAQTPDTTPQGTVPAAASGTTATGGVFRDDSGAPDLSKIQIMAWTLIAIGTYLIRLIEQVNVAAGLPAGPGFNLDLPDIDEALMVLMGLGHGAYIGKKLVTTTTPRLTGLAPGQGPAGSSVTLTGMAFGVTQDGSLLTIDGMSIHPDGLTWSDTQITFTIPATHPNGTPWGPGQRILIGLTVNGQQSANTLPFTVMASQQNPVAAGPPAGGGVNPQAIPTPVNPQITDAVTQVNPQITDAVTQSDPTQVNPQITDAAAQNDPATPSSQ